MVVTVLVTGGAGFIGSHVARSFATKGNDVYVLDDLSRLASTRRLRALASEVCWSRITVVEGDVRDSALVAGLVQRARPELVVHLAGQVAVSTSMSDPVSDFSVNARGTMNVLEAVRVHAPEARVVLSSTNKVYGALDGLRIRATDTRYELVDWPGGLSETLAVSPRTPYGCSKYVADLYMSEYARSFGLSTAVLRLSCVYGRMQSGGEDQGWVSWFVTCAVQDTPLTIYGDGRQVRDLLHVSDLVALIGRLAALDHWPTALVCNVGGGPSNSVSVWTEFAEILKREIGRLPKVSYRAARPHDQLVYVSDTTYVRSLTGWRPQVTLQDGVRGLIDEARAMNGS